MAFNLPLETTSSATIPNRMKVLEDLIKQRTENKFIPLDKAIKTQNAMAYSGKTGSIGQFLRGISELPVAERQAYLSDPANRRNYMQMLEDFRKGTAGGGSNSILTPEFINQQFSGGGGILAPILKAAFGGGQGQNAMNEEPSQGPGMNAMNEPSGAEQNFPYELGEIVPSPQGQRPAEPQSEEPIRDVPVSPNVKVGDRQLLSAQMLANNHMVGSQLKGRADNAIAFEKTMHNLRPQIQKVLSDAVKYSGIYGRGKGWLDKFKNNQPEEYANFITTRDSLIPLIGNGIAFIENMGQSHQAHEQARNLVIPLQQLDVAPDTAMKVFNNSMSYLDQVTQGVLDSAEPLHPGVRRRLAGVPQRSGDYIHVPKKSGKYKLDFSHLSDEELRKIAGEG